MRPHDYLDSFLKGIAQPFERRLSLLVLLSSLLHDRRSFLLGYVLFVFCSLTFPPADPLVVFRQTSV